MEKLAYRPLAAAIRQHVSRGTKRLVVTSSGPGEGKSTIAANLARALAHSGRHSVALVDADPFRPSLHKVFRADNRRGLGEALAEVYGMDVTGTESKQFGLGDWIELLRAQGRSGRLLISSGDEQYSIVFVRGSVASVSSRKGDGGRLGGLLVESGSITAEQKDVALKLQKEGQKPLGDVLHGLGYLEPAELKSALLLQLKESLHHIVTLAKPACRYLDASQDAVEAPVTSQFNPAENGTINDFVTGRFSDYLKDPFLSARLPEYLVDTDAPSLKLLPSGQAHYDPEDIALQLLLARLSRKFDIVLMDAPPIAATSPTRDLTAHAEGVIFVVKADGYDLKIVQQAKEQLERNGCNVLGVVLNQANVKQDATMAYYYGSYRR